MLSDAQLLRYSRQIMLDGIDVAGQEALLAASVVLVYPRRYRRLHRSAHSRG